MAKRLVFIRKEETLYTHCVEFKWNGGFAISQWQKNIASLHARFIEETGIFNVLEVSTKSINPEGRTLSAFNLVLCGVRIENIYQSSKEFQNGGPYRDLLNVESNKAKKDERLKNSGNLIAFDHEGTKWDVEPKTAFYDYIFISALIEGDLINVVKKYEAFTDIAFNAEKSISCQARACAIAHDNVVVDAVKNRDIEKYMLIYKEKYAQEKPYPCQ